MEIEDLFPGGRVERMRAHLAGFAAEFGVEMGSPTHLPNTRRALAMAEFARDRGRLDPFRRAAMEAHWRGGKDLENPDHLSEIARASGLDPVEALAAGTDPAYQARVSALREEGESRWVTGIPTFFFDRIPVVGCQPYAILARAAEKAGARRRG